MWMTLANRSSPRRKTTFLDLKCFECSLVSMLPFKAAPFLLTATMASSTFSIFSCIESRWTSSKSTGIPPALKMDRSVVRHNGHNQCTHLNTVRTYPIISGPIPSPGSMVTMNRPPYFACLAADACFNVVGDTMVVSNFF